MNYTVRWLPRAERELINLWLASNQRAAYLIDEELERAPEDLGESRSEGIRIHFEVPLAVLFRVLPDVHLVEVVHVREYA